MPKACVPLAVVLLLACAGEAPVTGPAADAELAAGGVRGKPSPGTPPSVAIVKLGFTLAFDVDNAGRVVGWQVPSSGPIRSLLWDPVTQQSTDLGDLGSGETNALAMNEMLQIAGGSEDATGWRPAVWDAGSWRPLPEAGGPIGVPQRTSATGRARTAHTGWWARCRLIRSPSSGA